MPAEDGGASPAPAVPGKNFREGMPTAMTRLPDIVPEKLDPAQRKIYDDIMGGPRGVVIGPHRVWLLSPRMADPAQKLGEFCRFHSSLAPHLSELAIITVGAYWRAGFEWFHHAPMAIKAGVSKENVEAIRTSGSPQFEDPQQQIVFRLSHELVSTHSVSESTYNSAISLLGEVPLVDLVAILGYYTLICMTIVAFELPADDSSDPFADVPKRSR